MGYNSDGSNSVDRELVGEDHDATVRYLMCSVPPSPSLSVRVNLLFSLPLEIAAIKCRTVQSAASGVLVFLCEKSK